MNDPVVVTRALRKVYGYKEALKGLNLAVPRGSIFALLGPNGAGKSTTFGILCSWLKATSGEARIFDRPPVELPLMRGKVTAVPQDAHLPHRVPVGVALRHLARLQGIRGEQLHREVERVLARVGLAEVGSASADELSHGMRKRINVAQALLGEPELIFLDEPTSGLDPRSARQIKDVLAQKASNTTIVISSHQLAEIQEICTHGAILDRGALVAEGTIEALTKKAEEVTIEVADAARVPMKDLEDYLGEGAATLTGNRLRLFFSQKAQPAEVITHLLQILLQHGVQIVEVRRGTSLESAYLAMTQNPDAE